MNMPAGTLVSVEEYLSTSYEPECEYLDGELVERNVGEIPHAKLQTLISGYFLKHRKKWGVFPLTEARIQISERRYRVPDVCVVRGDWPTERILTSPPWIWIEVLSPDDRLLRIQRKVREALDFGCEWVWVIDPETLESRVYTRDSEYELTDYVFRIPGTQVAVPLRELGEQ